MIFIFVKFILAHDSYLKKSYPITAKKNVELNIANFLMTREKEINESEIKY